MAAKEIRNPATGEVVGSVCQAQPCDFDSAEAGAREAQLGWATRALRDRTAIVRRFHDYILDECDRILDVIQSETGKARRDAFAEIVSVAGTARYYSSHAAEYLSGRQRQPAVPLVTNSEVTYKPHGLIGLISPWNYPFLLAIGDAIPALLAGNSVIVKPSELTPLSAQLARQVFVDAGLDSRLLTMVY